MVNGFKRQPMTVNLHTHTVRCDHAGGEDRDYVEAALAGGLRKLGFADHSWYVIDGGDYSSGMHVTTEKNEDYVKSVLSLREEYADRIDIKLGYEAEYYPKHFPTFIEMVRRYPIDYLILGPHFTNNKYDGIHTYRTTDDRDLLHLQINQIIEAIETGVFTYIAHPEIMNFADDTVYDEEYSRLIERAMELDVLLEINLLGIRGGRTYPNERFVKLCGKMGAKMCIGSDAHSPDAVCDFASYEKALGMAEKYGVEIVYDPVLKPIW